MPIRRMTCLKNKYASYVNLKLLLKFKILNLIIFVVRKGWILAKHDVFRYHQIANEWQDEEWLARKKGVNNEVASKIKNYDFI